MIKGTAINKMRTAAIQDNYNPQKVWVIKRSKHGHYFITQCVCGQQLYAFQRVPKAVITAILKLNNKTLKEVLA